MLWPHLDFNYTFVVVYVWAECNASATSLLAHVALYATAKTRQIDELAEDFRFCALVLFV